MIRCKGCGVILQNIDKNKLGYVETNEQELCMRCFRLSHYGEYRSVELDNKDYQKILDNIDPSALVVCVTDILSLNLDIVDKFKNALLVVTKKDILPKSVKDYKIIEYINKNIASNLSNEMLAKKFGYSVSYFRNVFYKAMNISPMQYVNKIRMEKAIEMLDSDYGAITNLAESLGYQNVYHFSSAFKKYYGLSPLQYKHEFLM